ncbi:MAG: hypothetical protein ACTHNB_04720 [Gaiellaceae bacterium]
MSKRLKVAGALVIALALAAVTAGSVARAGGAFAGAKKGGGNCTLHGHGTGIKHVIYLQFDNTHLFRDRSNVASDLEQMPHLMNFLSGNGTLSDNEHTILISHTAGGILSSLTGLYPDRTGQAVSNSYGYFRPNGSVGFSSSFKYWTDTTDGGNPANSPPDASADPNFNMITSGGANTPAPWVPWARAGCDVGNVSTANAVLENNNAIVFRTIPAPATLAAPASPGDTNVKVNSVAGLAAGQTVVIQRSNVAAEFNTIASVGTDGAGGTGVTLTSPLTNAHGTGAAFTVYTVDPTGDMTKVFGEGSAEWTEGRNAQVAPGGTAAAAVALTDFVGIGIHCAAGGGICKNNPNARPDVSPDEPTGFQGLFGALYVNPAINGGHDYVNDVFGSDKITDPFKHPGFPGFDGMPAKVTLGYVAQMQEAGVPVTFGYISDAHDNHTNAFPAPSDPNGVFPRASGPGESDYVQALQDYDKAFATFFERLKKDGINKHNTLFVLTADENDHFAGGVSNDGTWSHTFCNLDTSTSCPTNQIGEVNANLRSLLPTPVNQPFFSVHSDSAPTVYVTNNPGPTDPKLRQLERDVSNAQALDPYVSNQKTPVALYLADKIGENALHMQTADAARTPSFTLFANPDYFLTAGMVTSGPLAGTPTKSGCGATTAFVCVDYHFAWSHGDATDDIGRTWLGMVGPGVKNLGLTSGVWTDHTDLQPTILSLAGLKDDYVPDGRVITQFLKNGALPSGIRHQAAALTQLGAVYKEINAPFGPLSFDVLNADTKAIASGSGDPTDNTYNSISARIASLTSDRDALAAQMRTVLNNAAFGGPVPSTSDIYTLALAGDTLLTHANQLGVGYSP